MQINGESSAVEWTERVEADGRKLWEAKKSCVINGVHYAFEDVFAAKNVENEAKFLLRAMHWFLFREILRDEKRA